MAAGKRGLRGTNEWERENTTLFVESRDPRKKKKGRKERRGEE